MEHPPFFDSFHQERSGFSIAMLIYPRVCLFNDNALSLIKPMRGLDLLPAGVRLRRLAQAVAFDVRITWLLGASWTRRGSGV